MMQQWRSHPDTMQLSNSSLCFRNYGVLLIMNQEIGLDLAYAAILWVVCLED